MICILICAGLSHAQDSPTPTDQLRARAFVETSEEVGLFWEHVADYCSKEDPKRDETVILTPLLDPKAKVHVVKGAMHLSVGKKSSDLLFPIDAEYHFWLAVSPKVIFLVGAPSSKKLIFERHLIQLGDDAHSNPDRQDSKERLAKALLAKGWERWAVVLLQIEAETAIPSEVKCEIDKDEVRITGLGTPRSFTATQLEAVMGAARAIPPSNPEHPGSGKADSTHETEQPKNRPTREIRATNPGVPQPLKPSGDEASVQSLVHSSAAQGHRYAFFVGVQDYDNASQHLPRLSWTLNDAKELCKAFRLAGYECAVMSDDQPDLQWRPDTAEKIRARLNEWLKSRTTEDNIVLCFSGHGLQLVKDRPFADGTRETYFCPRNADIVNTATLLPFVDGVFKAVGKCPAANKLILIDACRERYETGNGKDGDSKIDYPGVASETRNPTKAVLATGLSVIYSCGDGGKSAESSVLQHGIFIQCVLESAQKARQTPLRLYQLADEVSRRTEEYTSHVQIPTLQANCANWDVFAPMRSAAVRLSEQPQVWLVLDWSEPMQRHKHEMCLAVQELARSLAPSDQGRLSVFLAAGRDCVAWPLLQVLQGDLPPTLPAPHDKQTIQAAATAVALARKEPNRVLLGFISWNPRYSIADDFERDWKAANEGREHSGCLVQHAQEVRFRVLQVMGDNEAVRQVFNRLAGERYQQYDEWPTQLPGPMQMEMRDHAPR